MPDRAMAAQRALLKRRYRPAWGALEDAVVMRFVRDFVSGRYRSVAEAAKVCRKRLDRLHAVIRKSRGAVSRALGGRAGSVSANCGGRPAIHG